MPTLEFIVNVQAHVVVTLPEIVSLKEARKLAERAVSEQSIPETFAEHLPPDHTWVVDREATSDWELSDAYEGSPGST